MNSMDRFSQSAAEDRQASVSMSVMDSMASEALDDAINDLRLCAARLERASWNSSAIDVTDATNQITDLLQDIEAMKIKVLESA